MQRVDNLPEFNINPLEGDYFLKESLTILLILLLFSLFVSGLMKIIFSALTIVVTFFIFSHLYGRLSSNWRKLHYPLMCRYASAVAYVRGLLGDKKEKELDIDLVLQCLLQSVFPNVEGRRITKLVQDILLREGKKLQDEQFVREIFARKLPELSEQDLSSLVRKITELNKNPTDTATANYIKTRLIIAFLVERRYGREEKSDYLYAVLTGKAR